ncbi:hypothetical protein [Chromobacterium alticapitis]|uniref:Uncharacterized protein n=1 Tax=Chromobacterium alticapitis TaxID=2073169 RepID=A0A2S5DES3_9NEIS|nr:hypothetical protein [Chromobacterium alticapitis]POZ61603.1 hypothetical protein C2I19_12455 [Chromobacterium alticapitis]
MKIKLLVVALGAVSGIAQAGWRPVIRSDNLNVAVNYGGGSVAYAESRIGVMGPLGRVVSQLKALPYDLQQGLNGRVAPMINQNGASFQGGSVSGNAVVTIQPSASGVTYLSVSGLNYQVTSHFSARKWGVIKADCTNTLTLSNIAVTGQYGSVNGVLDPGPFNAELVGK